MFLVFEILKNKWIPDSSDYIKFLKLLFYVHRHNEFEQLHKCSLIFMITKH